jgi:predicted aspartyl protease
MRWFGLVISVVVIAVLACARPRPRRAVELPLIRTPTGHLVISIDVNDRDGLKFVLDTGASGTVITPATRELLQLRPVAGAVAAAGAGGELANAAQYRLTRVRVGGREYRDLAVWESSLDEISAIGPDLAGILGRDFLAQHELEIDLPGQVVRLLAPGERPLPGRAARVPFTNADDGLMHSELEIAGVKIPAIFDLGAQVTILNDRAVKAAMLEPAGGAGAATASGADGTPTAMLRQKAKRIRLGDLELADRFVFSGDLPVFAALGLDQGPAALLGLDLLGDRAIRIDFATRTIHLWESPPAR